jgi:hypothetical protein
MTGAMSGRIFWGLVLASAVGRLVFAGGVVWAVNKWREEIAADVDPFAPRFPLAAGSATIPASEELDASRDTFIWMWVIVALLVVSAIHSLYAYFARPSTSLSGVVDWGQRRVDEERRREAAAGIDAGPGPNAGAASNSNQQQQQQQQARPRVIDENRPTVYGASSREGRREKRRKAPTPPHPPPPLLPFLPLPPVFPHSPPAEIGITPDDDDPFGMRAEDELEIEEKELIERASAGPNAPVKPRRIPIALSQILFGFITASVAVAMATTPSDWILPYDAEEGKPLAYLLASAQTRRATAFLIRFMAVIKLSTCFYPALVVAEDGRLRTIINARTYTIMGLMPVCWLAGFWGSGVYYGVGWATGLFFIVDELVGLFLTFLELMWSIRTWMTRQKAD